MVDRPSLIKALEPLSKTTSSQAENVRKLLEKALTELVIALPLKAAQELNSSDRAELATFLTRLDPRAVEKIAKNWEPKRKLDPDIKRTLVADLLELIEARRSPYEPVKATLDVARTDALAVLAALELAPIKDLTAAWKSWDKHNKPIPMRRPELLERLSALVNGEAPIGPPAKASRRR